MPEKYQDEIEEILKGIEEEGPAVPPRNSQPIIDDLPLSLPDDRNRDSDRTGPRSRWLAVTPGEGCPGRLGNSPDRSLAAAGPMDGLGRTAGPSRRLPALFCPSPPGKPG